MRETRLLREPLHGRVSERKPEQSRSTRAPGTKDDRAAMGGECRVTVLGGVPNRIREGDGTPSLRRVRVSVRMQGMGHLAG
jgi:hypothetical protein